MWRLIGHGMYKYLISHMINPEIIDPLSLLTLKQIEFFCRWIKALRSEQYIRGDGCLKTAEIKKDESGRNILAQCYCALGIAANLKAIEQPELWFWVAPDGLGSFKLQERDEEYEKQWNTPAIKETEEFALTDRMAVEIGFSKIPSFEWEDVTTWNDDYGWPFSTIADEIEQKVIAYATLHKYRYEATERVAMIAALKDAGCTYKEVLEIWLDIPN